jgi:hypothetical protein
MRWYPLILVATFAGCVLPSTSGGTSSSGTGADDAGTSVCSSAADCSSCVNCALVNPCAALYNACIQDPYCNSVDQCFATCSGVDASCKQDCLTNNANGAAQYQGVLQCVYCQQCSKGCPGQCSM